MRSPLTCAPVPDGRVLPYSAGRSVDRAGQHREDPAWLRTALAAGSTRVVALWHDDCPVLGTPPRPALLPGPVVAAWDLTDPGPVFLGRHDNAAVFAVDLSAMADADARRLTGADQIRPIRELFGRVDAVTAAVLAQARGLLHWHRHQRFCPTCGSPTIAADGGNLRRCRGTGCGRALFPRIEPAVIVLVESPATPARCLLARHAGAPADAYATLAGFVEVGESLEDAVHREVAEEAGMTVRSLRYVASQPWPFPAGLMVGFRAVAGHTAIRIDGRELAEARWFTPDQVRRLRQAYRRSRPDRGVDSIEDHLLDGWLRDTAAAGT